MDIRIAATPQEVRACFPAFVELRPHLDEDGFVEQVLRQQAAHGYVMAYVAPADGEPVPAATGFRIAEFLAWGKALYVDDLVTRAAARKRGHAGALLDWLIAQARERGCGQLHLDSGVHRHDAHRLYLGRKLQINSHHFSIAL